MKNVLAALVDFAAEQGLPLNLGGGISRGDRTRGVQARLRQPRAALDVSEIVCDPAAYARLSAGRDPGGFFPAYRAP